MTTQLHRAAFRTAASDLINARRPAPATAQDERSNDHHVELFWRTASGFGHGRQWATLNVLVREQVAPLGSATATVKMSNTESRVLWGAATAYELIDRSWRLYHAACGHDQPPSSAGQQSQ